MALLAVGVQHTGPEPGYRSGKQRLVLRRPRQYDGALDAQYSILGSLAGVRWIAALADKSISEGANPSDEVSGDCGGKPIACSVESKSTDEANASTRAKIGIDSLPHAADGNLRRFVAQGLENMAFEPGVYVVEYGLGHVFLATRKKVMEAALSHAGFLGNPAQGRPLVAELPKDFGYERYDVRALVERPHAMRLAGLEAQIREPGVTIRTPAERPMEFTIRFLDRKVVDAGEPALHQAGGIIFAVLVAV